MNAVKGRRPLGINNGSDKWACLMRIEACLNTSINVSKPFFFLKPIIINLKKAKMSLVVQSFCSL